MSPDKPLRYVSDHFLFPAALEAGGNPVCAAQTTYAVKCHLAHKNTL